MGGGCIEITKIKIQGEKVWDYSGCLYPEGYIGPDKVFLFDGEQIERVYAVGYQDEEQFAFKVQADAALEEFRKSVLEEKTV